MTTNTAFAANFTVTSEHWDGPGSLRQAVLDANANANANPGEVDTITFDPSVKMINQGDLHDSVSGPIHITQSVSIEGSSADSLTIDGFYIWLSLDGKANSGLPEHGTIIAVSGYLFHIGT